ncbi:MAG TPA: DeoR family transcriptional regulator [Candidatus Paceibacterota bacterium]|nr:DeoR family transcriptional regulator [Candidatus Paceibacterota bacterium]
MIVIKEEFQKRKQRILQKVVSSYLEKGEPVASSFLVYHYHLDLSSATIRNDFQKLSKEGYLYKSHISSGRLPTDKALKFFISNILESGEIDEWKNKWFDKLKERTSIFKDFEKAVEFLSEETKSFSFFYLLDDQLLIKRGLRYLFANIDNSQDNVLELIEKVAESLESFDNQVKNLEIKEGPLVYIGRENPFVKIDCLSFLGEKSHFRDGIFGILGSKRMPYEKNLGLIQAMAEVI